MTAYVYALQPVGMPIIKIGSTRNPQQRAQSIAAFAPCPMQFVRLVAVKNNRHARIWEHFLHGKTMAYLSHGEWRHLNEAVLGSFDVIDGEDADIDHVMFEKRQPHWPNLSIEQVQLRLLMSDVSDAYEGHFSGAPQAAGIPKTWKNANGSDRVQEFIQKAKAYLFSKGAT